MNRRVCVMLCWIVATWAAAAAAADKGPIKILIDASKDGGVWWSPQSKYFDQNAAHQGKAVADALRAKGYVVEELGRDVEVNPAMLRGAKIVVRPRIHFDYKPAEVEAYQEAIAKGLPVVLLAQPVAKADALSSKLGLQYGDFQEIGAPYTVRKHSLAQDLAQVESQWATIAKLPEGATAIASMSSGNHVAALQVVEKGAIVVIGAPQQTAAPLLFNLIPLLTGTPAAELKKKLDAAKEEQINLPGPNPPALVTPTDGAVVEQGPAVTWHFEWARAENAVEYEIICFGPSASFPLVRARTPNIAYDKPFGQGQIQGNNKANWTWSVRARNATGAWGEWSRTRKFDVK